MAKSFDNGTVSKIAVDRNILRTLRQRLDDTSPPDTITITETWKFGTSAADFVCAAAVSTICTNAGYICRNDDDDDSVMTFYNSGHASSTSNNANAKTSTNKSESPASQPD